MKGTGMESGPGLFRVRLYNSGGDNLTVGPHIHEQLHVEPICQRTVIKIDRSYPLQRTFELEPDTTVDLVLAPETLNWRIVYVFGYYRVDGQCKPITCRPDNLHIGVNWAEGAWAGRMHFGPNYHSYK